MIQRHQLIYLKKNAKFELTSTHLAPVLIRDAIYEWIQAPLPCIYTRQQALNPSLVHLGLTLLIEQKRHRAGLRIDASMIERASNLPTFSEYSALFPKVTCWRDKSIHVYGSYLFQYLSKNTLFVNNHSDLDILIAYQNTSLNTLEQKINLLANETQRRIDGEIRFDGVGDLSISELIHTTSNQLLVKTTTNTFLMSRNKLYEHYPSLLD